MSSKEQPQKLKFNRVAEIVLANEDPETQIEEVEMVASIGIPFRDNFYYTMMVKRRESFYSLQTSSTQVQSQQKNQSFLHVVNAFFSILLSNSKMCSIKSFKKIISE